MIQRTQATLSSESSHSETSSPKLSHSFQETKINTPSSLNQNEPIVQDLNEPGILDLECMESMNIPLLPSNSSKSKEAFLPKSNHIFPEGTKGKKFLKWSSSSAFAQVNQFNQLPNQY